MEGPSAYVCFCEGQSYGELRSRAAKGSEAGEKLAVAFPFEIKMKLAFSLHQFVRNYVKKATRKFAPLIQRNSKFFLISLCLYGGGQVGIPSEFFTTRSHSS